MPPQLVLLLDRLSYTLYGTSLRILIILDLFSPESALVGVLVGVCGTMTAITKTAIRKRHTTVCITLEHGGMAYYPHILVLKP